MLFSTILTEGWGVVVVYDVFTGYLGVYMQGALPEWLRGKSRIIPFDRPL